VKEKSHFSCKGMNIPVMPLALLALMASFPLSAADFHESFDTVAATSQWVKPEEWHAVNRVPEASNALEISRTQSASQPHSLKATAAPSDSIVSKASVERKGFDFREGDELQFQASFFIEPGADLDELYLMDIECGTCYSQAPGPRLKIAQGILSIDRGKLGFAGSFKAIAATIRTGEWFEIRWNMILGKNAGGKSLIFLNGKKVMDTVGTNMPDRSVFLENGVTLETEKLEQFEIGVTANSSTKPVTLYVDDVSVTREESLNLLKPRKGRAGTWNVQQECTPGAWTSRRHCDVRGRFFQRQPFQNRTQWKERQRP
jgi:hypothetical protein